MLKFVCGMGALSIVVVASLSVAQPPAREGRADRRRESAADVVTASVDRMMAFDSDQDGKLSKAEVTDARLAALFERADADKDEVVTKDELTALFKQEAALLPRAGRGGFGAFDGPPGGFGNRGGGARAGGDRGRDPADRERGPGGPDPNRRPGSVDAERGPPRVGPGGPPRPGEVLPGFLQDALELSRRQRDQLEKLQAEVDARLARILTEEQIQRLGEFRDRAPGGPRGPGRPDGPPPARPGDERPPRGDRRPPRPD